MTHFRILGLPASAFTDLFSLVDADLAQRNARRMTATGPGFPCRISLTDAAVGDTVLLVNHAHHCVASPYRSAFAIYVREGEETFDAVDDVPDQLRRRLLSLRGYDHDGMLRAADVVDGQRIEELIGSLFTDPAVAYIHAHYAKPGCYAAMIERS